MEILVDGLGKRYNYEWIFRNINILFSENSTWAITGPNGSGKSTLAKILLGYTALTEGKITYSSSGKLIEEDQVYQCVSFTAPYVELIEEFTLKEFLTFHFKFKKNTLENIDQFLEKVYLTNSSDKQIKFFSSGMKQRLKLGLAFFSDSKMMVLDEPTTNLDAEGTRWYKKEIAGILGKRLTLICSNQPLEYDFCENIYEVRK